MATVQIFKNTILSLPQPTLQGGILKAKENTLASRSHKDNFFCCMYAAQAIQTRMFTTEIDMLFTVFVVAPFCFQKRKKNLRQSIEVMQALQ